MANLKDMLAQVKTQLLAQNWTGGSNKVFATGSVLVSRHIPEAALRTMRVPLALIMPGTIRSDPQYNEEPDLFVVQVIVRVIHNVPGDAVGENPLMGANRPDVTKSEGAGILEVMEEVYNAIGRLNVQDHSNFIIQFRQRGGAGGIHIDATTYWVYADLEFEGICTAA